MSLGPSTEAWLNPTNARLADGQPATPQAMTNDDVTDLLVVSNFGFAVPSAARIVGLSLAIRRRGDSFGLPIDFFTDQFVQVVGVNGGGSANRAMSNSWGGSQTPPGMPGPFLTTTYGGPNDVWGFSFTPAAINNSNFGFGYSVRYSFQAGNGTPEVDQLQATVHTCE